MSVVSLTRDKNQPPCNFTGSTKEASENWTLKVSENLVPIQAQLLIESISRDVNNSYGFSVIGKGHPYDSSLIAVGYNTAQREPTSFTIYDITISFTNSRSSINSSVSPLDAAPNISYDMVDNVVVVEFDQENPNANKPIQNSAGTPIILTENEPMIRCTIVRQENNYSARRALSYAGTVNSGSVRIVGETFAAGTAKLERWTGSNQYDANGRLYWSVTYQILFRDEGFVRKVIDKGLLDINKRPPVSSKGFKANTEYKLNGAGSFMSNEDQADPTKSAVLEFNTLRVSNWGPPTRLGSNPTSDISDLIEANAPLGLTS